MSRYIDADETLEQIRKKLGVKSLDYLLEAERQIIAVIQSMPSIDIEPKRGKWIEDICKYDRAYHFKCSVCGEWNGLSVEEWNWKPNFCPNCGASMTEREGE